MQARSDVTTAAQAGPTLWQSTPALPLLPDNTIHVWRLRPKARLASEAYLPYLRPEEIERSRRFLFPEDQRQSIATRATLRLLLAHYASVANAGEIEVSIGPHGKPFLADSRICFNLSHTRDLAIFAFALEFDIGVDVERAHITNDLDDVAEQNFAAAERAALSKLSPAERATAFYRCWTRKEALLKAEGTGLFRALDSFAVPLDAGEPAQRLQGVPEGWEIAPLQVLPDAPGAVAWRHHKPQPTLALFDWAPSLASPQASTESRINVT